MPRSGSALPNAFNSTSGCTTSRSVSSRSYSTSNREGGARRLAEVRLSPRRRTTAAPGPAGRPRPRCGRRRREVVPEAPTSVHQREKLRPSSRCPSALVELSTVVVGIRSHPDPVDITADPRLGIPDRATVPVRDPRLRADRRARRRWTPCRGRTWRWRFGRSAAFRPHGRRRYRRRSAHERGQLAASAISIAKHGRAPERGPHHSSTRTSRNMPASMWYSRWQW